MALYLTVGDLKQHLDAFDDHMSVVVGDDGGNLNLQPITGVDEATVIVDGAPNDVIVVEYSIADDDQLQLHDG